MSTKIRLARGGSTKKPFYRVVVTNSRSPRDGAFIEKVGTYNPLLEKTNPKRIELDIERIQHWLKVGAQPTEVITRFLRQAGVISTPAVYTGAPKVSKKEKKAAAA